jgi:hypothetical protein
MVRSQPGNSPRDPISKKPITIKGLEWLKVKALSSNPHTEKKKKITESVLGIQ